MQDIKKQFSEGELSLMNDEKFFLLKHDITKKIELLFTDLLSGLENSNEQNGLNKSILAMNNAGKIFKGENYLQFPYINLDYPREFGNDVFAYRSMFWWGHHFSFTLHLSGKYYELAKSNWKHLCKEIKNKEVYYCIHSSPWHYHFNKDNYLLFSEVEEKQFHNSNFLKLSTKIEVNRVGEVVQKGTDFYNLLMKSLFLGAAN